MIEKQIMMMDRENKKIIIIVANCDRLIKFNLLLNIKKEGKTEEYNFLFEQLRI